MTEHRMEVNLYRYRVMFDDGAVHDFIDIADTSRQRQAWRELLGHKDTKGPAILGVAHLGHHATIAGDDTPADLFNHGDH